MTEPPLRGQPLRTRRYDCYGIGARRRRRRCGWTHNICAIARFQNAVKAKVLGRCIPACGCSSLIVRNQRFVLTNSSFLAIDLRFLAVNLSFVATNSIFLKGNLRFSSTNSRVLKGNFESTFDQNRDQWLSSRVSSRSNRV
jgi:hypothetical protein